MNHTGHTHPWFLTAQADASSAEAGFYIFREHPDDYLMWLDAATLPKLDHRSVELRAGSLPARTPSRPATWLRPSPWTAGASTPRTWRAASPTSTSRRRSAASSSRRRRPPTHCCSPSTATTPAGTCAMPAGTGPWPTRGSRDRCGAGSAWTAPRRSGSWGCRKRLLVHLARAAHGPVRLPLAALGTAGRRAAARRPAGRPGGRVPGPGGGRSRRGRAGAGRLPPARSADPRTRWSAPRRPLPEPGRVG